MRVYICCSPEDHDAYEELAKKLQAQGDSVINEELNTNSTEQSDNTEEQIKNADIVISIITNNSIQSSTAQGELGYALFNKNNKTATPINESKTPIDNSLNESDNKPGRKLKPLYGIAIALVLILFAIGASQLLKRNHSSQDTPTTEDAIESVPQEKAEIDNAETNQAATELATTAQAAIEQIAVEKKETTDTDTSHEATSPEEQPPAGEDEIDSEPEAEAEIDQIAVENTVMVEADIPSDAVTFEGHSYYIFDNGRKSWNEANEFCESQGGYLAVINSSGENEFLYDYMIKAGFKEVFFGYTDQYTEGSWEWVSDKTSDYTDWGTTKKGNKQPDAYRKNEDYAQLNSGMRNGHWNDQTFSTATSRYYCEWNLIDYQETDYNGKAAENGVPLRNDASSESDIIVKLKQNEEVQILFLLTDDDGDQWYYVQNKAGLYGYIEPASLIVD